MLMSVVISKSQGLRVLKSLLREVDAQFQVITCDDRPDTDRTVFEDIHRFCESQHLDLSVLDGHSLNQHLLDTNPDLCLISGWYWLIEVAALNACRLGCLGIHNSLLPKFRGGAPLVWSIMTGDKTVGASLFLLVPDMDAGPLLHQWELDVEISENVGSILTRLEDKIVSNLGLVLNEYISGTRQPYPQSVDGVSYAAQRRKNDSEIDWTCSADSLLNQYRALQDPYPPLYFVKRQSEYQIRGLQKAPFECWGKAGKVLAYIDSGMVVSCGNHAEGLVVTALSDDKGETATRNKPFPIGALLISEKS